MDFFGSRRCLRRPGFDSYFAPIIKFIRPDYYQCFLSNRDIMVFFGQLWLLVTMHWFYAKRQTKAEKAGEKDDSFHISVSWCCWVAIFKKIWAPKAKCQTFFYVHWNTPNHSNLYFSLLESSGKHPLPFFLATNRWGNGLKWNPARVDARTLIYLPRFHLSGFIQQIRQYLVRNANGRVEKIEYGMRDLLFRMKNNICKRHIFLWNRTIP